MLSVPIETFDGGCAKRHSSSLRLQVPRKNWRHTYDTSASQHATTSVTVDCFCSGSGHATSARGVGACADTRHRGRPARGLERRKSRYVTFLCILMNVFTVNTVNNNVYTWRCDLNLTTSRKSASCNWVQEGCNVMYSSIWRLIWKSSKKNFWALFQIQLEIRI